MSIMNNLLLRSFILILLSYIAYISCFNNIRSQSTHRLVFPRLNVKMEVAPFKKARSQNTPGNLYVDESCIDCDVCRWMCPSVFDRKGVKSAVHSQPRSDDEKLKAYAAMVACPVGSIRAYKPDPLMKEAINLFPAEIDPVRIPGVMHLGFHSPLSFSATPYFIKRENGNIMIDTPRYNSKLAKTIEEEGGVSVLILTHKDDIADQQKWKDRFPEMERVIHRTDVTRETETCETQLEGEGPWQPDDDVTIIHTPGHTAGSICILVKTKNESVLFTGDHIAYSKKTKGLVGFKQYNKGNLDLQADSMRVLADEDLDFLWILPGHSRMVRFSTLEEKKTEILKAADQFQDLNQLNMFGMGYQ